MTERPPNEVEKTDINQRSILGLMCILFGLLAIIGFVLLKFDKLEFKLQSRNKTFFGEQRIINKGEMDDFESGGPREKLDQEQRKNLLGLNNAINSLSTKSISEIDGLFIKREKKR